MRFLIVSYVFLPSLGGTEMASLALAQELQRRGHQVTVVTATPGGTPLDLPFAVEHRPGPARLLTLHRWADIVIHNGFTLRFAWPLLLIRRPWLTIHQTFLPNRRLHRFLVRFTRNVANSHFLAKTLPVPAQAIPNSYRPDIFHLTDVGSRPYELAFLGRLVSDKGPMLLLEALARLKERGRQPRLLMIGSGPEEAALRDFATRHALSVEFAGARFGLELAGLLNQARILVVPSTWQEPFGIVALEGIACGCAVIGSDGGGLPEAIGPCGLVFKSGDMVALSVAIGRLLETPALVEQCRAAAPAHLARHTPQVIVDRYLDVLGIEERR